MSGNMFRRRIYTRGAPPAADAIHIDGFSEMVVDWIDEPWPDLTWDEVWRLVADDYAEAFDAGVHTTWGRGLPGWDVTPDDNVSGETELENLLGAFPATWAYIEPDVAGAIEMSDGTKWSLAGEQTLYMLVTSPYAATNEPTAAIRELALYLGTEADAGHEADAYLPVSNIADIGALHSMDRISIANRSSATSGKVRFLITLEN